MSRSNCLPWNIGLLRQWLGIGRVCGVIGSKGGGHRGRHTDLVLDHPPAQHLPGAVIFPPDPSYENDVDVVVALLVKGAVHELELLGAGVALDLGAVLVEDGGDWGDWGDWRCRLITGGVGHVGL